MMQGLQCKNCGAPLQIKPEDLSRGFASCQFCGNSYKLGAEPGPEMDADVRRGLKILSMADRMFEIAPLDLNEPAERPVDSRIELQSVPGYSLNIKIPRRGLSLQSGFMALFTTFWCGFMVMWNGIGIVQGQWIMVLFGLLHDAVGAFLLISTCWQILGREELSADQNSLRRVQRLLFFKREKTFERQEIKDVIFRIVSRQAESQGVTRGLFLVSAAGKQRIASNAGRDDQRWIRTELRRFLGLER